MTHQCRTRPHSEEAAPWSCRHCASRSTYSRQARAWERANARAKSQALPHRRSACALRAEETLCTPPLTPHHPPWHHVQEVGLRAPLIIPLGAGGRGAGIWRCAKAGPPLRLVLVRVRVTMPVRVVRPRPGQVSGHPCGVCQVLCEVVRLQDSYAVTHLRGGCTGQPGWHTRAMLCTP